MWSNQICIIVKSYHQKPDLTAIGFPELDHNNNQKIPFCAQKETIFSVPLNNPTQQLDILCRNVVYQFCTGTVQMNSMKRDFYEEGFLF